MNVLATIVGAWTGGTDGTDGAATQAEETNERRARCRNCGRYYGASAECCPHCGSGNRLLGGPAGGQNWRL